VDVLQLICLSLLAFALGLVFLLAGYRFFLLLLPIWGFFAGLWLGAQTISILLGEGFLASVTALIVGIVVGLILAVLSYFFYSIGVLLLGASFGYWLGSAVMNVIGLDPGFVATVVAIIIATIFAALTVLLDVKKHLIVVITALGGASGLLISAVLVFGRISIADLQAGAAEALGVVIDDSIFWLILWLVLAAGGILVQEMTTREFYLEYDRKYEPDSAS